MTLDQIISIVQEFEPTDGQIAILAGLGPMICGAILVTFFGGDPFETRSTFYVLCRNILCTFGIFLPIVPAIAILYLVSIGTHYGLDWHESLGVIFLGNLACIWIFGYLEDLKCGGLVVRISSIVLGAAMINIPYLLFIAIVTSF